MTYEITGRFGDERPGHRHAGIDIGVPLGTVPISPVAGKVIRADNRNAAGYGNLVVVRGSDGRDYYFAHLASFAVKVGQAVTVGTPLGTSGRSGNATGPTMHFEVREKGKAVDPSPYYSEAKVFAGSGGTDTATSDTATSADRFPDLKDNATDAEILTYIKRYYPDLYFYAGIGELRPIILEAVRARWDDARIQGRLHRTTWWTGHNNTYRQWQLLVATNPGEARSQRAAMVTQVQARYRALLGEDLEDAHAGRYAENILSGKYGSDGIGLWTQRMSDLAETRIDTPTARATIAQLQDMARGYLLPLDTRTLNGWAVDINRDLKTVADFETWLRGQAAATFPGFKEQILAGASPSTLFGGYTSAASQLLGTPIGFDDPYVRSAVTTLGKDGQPIPIWQMEQNIREHNPRYRTSRDAQTHAVDIAEFINQRFGAVTG